MGETLALTGNWDKELRKKFRKAVDICGGGSKFARRFDVSCSQVSQIYNGYSPISKRFEGFVQQVLGEGEDDTASRDGSRSTGQN